MLMMLLLAIISGTIVFFVVNTRGFEKEIGRNVRDIGSNIVILPADADQFSYHQQGGFTASTMPSSVVDQLIEFRASLNHLIPMLERKAKCQLDDRTAVARVVGLAASIPVPGRPKAPMQRAIETGKVQLGSELAARLGISRDDDGISIMIDGATFPVDRVNRGNGTWQDSAVLMDLKSAQALFKLGDKISRIEAIECTQEKCEETGLQSDVVLSNELASITDAAVLLRREQMADARRNVRSLNSVNLALLKNLLWTFLACSMIALAFLNTVQRRAEIGVLQSIGFGQLKIATMFVLRSLFLGIISCSLGVVAGAFAAYWQSQGLFLATGKKFEIDWNAGITIGIVAVCLSVMATLIPAVWSASRHPAELIGRDV